MPPGGKNKPQHRYSVGRSRLKVLVLKGRWVVMPVKRRLTLGVSMASREVLPSGSQR